MVREFELPDVGEGLAEAEVVSWLVSVGDAVTEDQPVAEVETDKAVVEVPSPVNGTVKEILAEEGEMVPVGNVIITFATEEDETASEESGDTESDESEAESAISAVSEVGDEDEDAEAGGTAAKGGRVFASPSARRLARELDVDIAAVEGSGPGGRVSDADVRAHAASDDEEEAVESAVEPATAKVGEDDEEEPAPTGDVARAGRDQTLAAPATRRLAEEESVNLDDVPTDETRDGEAFVRPEQVREFAETQRAAQAADTEAVQAGQEAGAVSTTPEQVDQRETREPYTGIRRTIGEQMETSKYTAPHVTHHDEVDVTKLVETRARLKEEAEARGQKLSYMPFVLKAVVAGLREYPVLNSQLDEEADEIVTKHYYNIGVAAATDAGLMVPVVDAVDQKGLLQLSEEMNELVAAARDRSIAREDMQGGTFSITNFGAIGGEYATPIINYPETAILGLGAIKEKPRVVDGEVVPRHVLTLSLSIDHRVIDGAEAAAFTNTVKEHLQNPELLLL
ncbi:dihydrolipoamide acetyltransferase family protein [Halosegnis rubeus]|uniref:2-oxo acid dehydrogenase subunit E2 n=1 Tax=Halosegnis rubeus TaxID=2212850 RepID=A0A5N5U9D5_9EURY|nr:dihydrolipoamide acetyltransferase family protein [Halosegnis rubeus]KAB7515147.1 2-oxo acid dehydrogenase subunit E2 [Halosegnis rubeus]